MDTISLKLPKLLLDRVEEAARDRRRSKSAVIRDCIHEALLQPKRAGVVSCHDLAPHLAGSVKGSPGLATDKRRLAKIFRERLRHR